MVVGRGAARGGERAGRLVCLAAASATVVLALLGTTTPALARTTGDGAELTGLPGSPMARRRRNTRPARCAQVCSCTGDASKPPDNGGCVCTPGGGGYVPTDRGGDTNNCGAYTWAAVIQYYDQCVVDQQAWVAEHCTTTEPPTTTATAKPPTTVAAPTAAPAPIEAQTCKLALTIISATGLDDPTPFGGGKADAYVVATDASGKEVCRTRKIQDNNAPTWNHACTPFDTTYGSPGITFLRMEKNRAVLMIGSGNHRFTSPYNQEH